MGFGMYIYTLYFSELESNRNNRDLVFRERLRMRVSRYVSLWDIITVIVIGEEQENRFRQQVDGLQKIERALLSSRG